MGLFDWIRKTKNTKTEVADTVKVAVQKPEREPKTWKCSCGRKNNDYVSTCTCGTNKREMVFSAAQQLDQTNAANNAEEKHNQETKNEIVQENADRRKESENEGQRHFLFSFIRPLDPSGLPFLEICVSIAIAEGTPYLQSFFCSSPSFPPAPMPLNTKPISFEELHELTLCELANIKREEKEWENKNRADLANRCEKKAQKLEKIVGTKESEWEELLNL